jgi:diguanylate cyclase (GGDEF)-like protein/PAS domain S-box-containing protein
MTKRDSTKSDSLGLLFSNSILSNISHDAQLEKLLNYYASLGHNYPDLIMVFSPDGDLRTSNQELKDVFTDIHKMEDFQRILLKKSYGKLESAFQHALDGNYEQCVVQIKRKKQYYETTVFPLQGKGENIVVGIVVIAKDITIHKKHEIQLHNENKSYRLIYDHLNIAIWVSEYKTGKLVYASQGLSDLYQYPQEDFYRDKLDMRMVIRSVVHPDDKRYVRKNALNILTNGDPINIRYRIKCQDDTVKWVTCKTTPYYDEHGNITHIFGLQTDITDEVKLEEQLTFIANHDLLTELPNHRSLEEKVENLMESETPFALLFFNLDRFSIINGALGYQVGDEVLKTIANRLRLILPENSFIARLKSNDFVILVEEYQSQENIANITENLLNDIKQPLSINGYEINITSSLGISLYPEDGTTKQGLMDKAHLALNHAKKRGPNTYLIYSSSEDVAFQRRLAIENSMIEALEKEEFELYYQPLVETHTGQILGAEALIRWNHKKWGLISPGEFIPIAEENQLINEISDWVIKKTCLQIKEWRDKGLTPIPISVNISPIRLMKKGLTEYVRTQLETYNIPADYLGVEITEGSLLKSEKVVIDTLYELKSLGVRIAIDDFGTGFASLNYLREYHADTLKIDQVFIQSRDGQVEKDNIIVGSVMQMAKGLKMRIIAEGVEEYGQYRFLKNRDCDIIQGYLFSRPVPVPQFEGLLEKGYLEPDPEKVEKDRLKRVLQ